MSVPDLSQAGPWQYLFEHAMRLMSHLESQVANPSWSFGGGTVLMLRIGHRQSRDIDLFIPDPQMLGYLSPRLSEVAEAITTDYEENAEFIKLYLPHGEIDVVVGEALTAAPFDLVSHGGRDIRVETSAEILAKKLWHRGDRGAARDLFDLCAVAQHEPEAIAQAAPFFSRFAAQFIHRLQDRADIARKEFDAIDALGFNRTFDECLDQAREILGPCIRLG
jgi:predicted nucleotidyltransferase component of viral defense system